MYEIIRLYNYIGVYERIVQHFLVLPDRRDRLIDHRAIAFLKIALRTLCRLDRDGGGKTCIFIPCASVVVRS